VLTGTGSASAHQQSELGQGRQSSVTAEGKAGVPVTSAGSVSIKAAAADPCGAYSVGWNRWYHHCTSDGSSVQVLARYVFQKNRIYCVGPDQYVTVGVENSYSLDWNGQTCSNPGTWW
jgi:hypothetical protein